MPGTSLNSQAQQFVLNLYEYFVLEKENGGPIESVSSVQERVAAALKISRKTVYTIRKRYENNSILCSPDKPRPSSKDKKTASSKLPKMSITQKLHNIMRKEAEHSLPTSSNTNTENKEIYVVKGGAPDPLIPLKSQFVTKLEVTDIKPEPADHPEFVNEHDYADRKCEVPMCENSWSKTPEKMFVPVPTNENLREKWFRLANRDEPPKSESVVYFCEDHFNMPNDMENYMEYQLAGWVPQIRMRPNCVPTKFHCQPDRKRPLAHEGQHTAVKRQKCDDNDQSNDVPSEITKSPHSSSTFPTSFTSNVQYKEKLNIKEELLDPASPSSSNCNIFNEEEPVIKQESTHSPSTSPTPPDCNVWTVEEIDIKDDMEICTLPELGEAATTGSKDLMTKKTKKLYMSQYTVFKKWCEERKAVAVTENVLLKYFKEKADANKKASTLWANYSMLKYTLLTQENIDISKFLILTAFLKQNNRGYKPKKSGSLTKEEINKFLIEAPDDEYLAKKAILVIGVAGACRTEELLNMVLDDIDNREDIIIINIRKSNTGTLRKFIIVEPLWIRVVKKYLANRPTDIRKLFILYRGGKHIKQNIGHNTISKVPHVVAQYLKLDNPECYTGHSLRRSSAKLLAESGQVLKW